MTAMAENISKTIVCDAELSATARRLPSPRDYYAGRRGALATKPLPENILLFHRREGQIEEGPGGRHFHRRHVLVASLRGEGRIVVNGRAFALAPGRCALIAPYQFHHFTRLPRSGMDWLFVTFELEENLAEGPIFQPGGGEFWGELERLIEAYLAGAEGARLACRVALMLDELARSKPVRAESRKRTAEGEALLLKVHGLVATHMGRILSVDEMARDLGMSASHLRAKFRKVAGRSIGDFQRELRLQKAAEVLRKGGATVEQTAAACGWESPFAFSRAFSRHWGMPPKRFALSVR